MTVLVDTCGWIEWLTDDALAEQFRPYLQRSAVLLVPTAVQYELYKWVRREMDDALALQIVALTEQSRVSLYSIPPAVLGTSWSWPTMYSRPSTWSAATVRGTFRG